jgi:hypothetical protein
LNKRITIAFLFLSSFAFGQAGAPTPAAAWNGGTPNAFWFEMDTDSDGSTWINKSGVSKELEFNTSTISHSYTPNTVYPSNSQNNYDGTYLWANDFFGLPGSNVPGPGFAFDEWFVIRVPSTGNIKINVDVSGSSSGGTGTVSLQWYELNSLLSEIGFTTYSTQLADFKDHKYSGTGLLQLNLDVDVANPVVSRITKNFVLIRIGINDQTFTGSLINNYLLSISTTNNNCKNALDFPDISIPFSSTTNDATKDLLDGSDEITLTDYNANKLVNVAGEGDIVLDNIPGNNGPGMWFEITTSEDSLYFATCESAFDPQLMIFSACPTGSYTVIGAENDNLFGGINDDNGNGGTDICLTGTFNTDLPLIKIKNASTPVTLYAYLFGNGDKGNFNFYILKGPSGILPVEWLDLTGYPNSQVNQLKWSTASEERNDYFILEKSSDGENYQELARIQGAGDALFESHYSFIDKQPYYLTYYRISQVDFDGTKDFGPQTVVKNESIFLSISILNQPVFDGQVKLNLLSSQKTEVSLDLLNMSGQVVLTRTVILEKNENKLFLNVNHVKDGIYILQLRNNAHLFTEKIIIQSLN